MVTVRVRKDISASIIHPTTAAGMGVVLVPGKEIDVDESVVREFPWAFERGVEEATAEPGRKRNVTRVQ